MSAGAEWNPAAVRRWLERRIEAARADQVDAQRHGRGHEDACDKAAAEELVCTAMRGEATTATPDGLVAALRALLDRDDYVWRGVYDDARFDRHVRTYARGLVKMAATNSGFEKLTRFR